MTYAHHMVIAGQLVNERLPALVVNQTSILKVKPTYCQSNIITSPSLKYLTCTFSKEARRSTVRASACTAPQSNKTYYSEEKKLIIN